MDEGECIFCSIASGRMEAQLVDEDEHTVAFMDINPWARGHALVVPRRHARDLHEIDPDDLGHVMLAAKRLAARMVQRLGCEQVVLWNSTGATAGQVMFHFHLHLIPRYETDGPVDLPRRQTASADELATTAARLTA